MWSTGAYGYLSDYLLWWIVLGTLCIHTWCFFRLWPRGWRRRLRLVLGNMLVASCLLASVGLVAETYLRFLSTETDALGVTLTSKRWFQAYPKLNSRYFRDDEWRDIKPGGVRRIAFVGDSFTYGWGIRDRKDRFSDLIQSKFDAARGERVEVMNAAWVGWDSVKEAAAIENMIATYDIDEAVLCYLPNDIDMLLPVSDRMNPREPPTSRFINTDASFLFDYLFYRVVARGTPASRGYCDWLWDGYADSAIWEEHTKTLRKIIQTCRDRDIVLRVVLVPLMQTWGERYDAAKLHARLGAFFRQAQIPVVDLLPSIDGVDRNELVVNGHDPHPNERAHAIFAESIWKAFYEKPPR